MATNDFFADIKPQEYEVYRPGYQRHYQVYFAEAGPSFADYEPAYRFGYDLAMDANYRDRYWAEIESEVRAKWEEKDPGSWDTFADAIEHAWGSLKEVFNMADDERYRFFEPAFKRHYEIYHSDTGKTYADVEPAYRLSYELAKDPRFHFHDWFEIEPYARQRWQEIGSGSWEDVAETLRPALEAVRRNQRLLYYGENETTYRRHYQIHYATVGGHDFSWYEPAYRYGYELAMDPKYSGQNWYSIENEVQRRWQESGEQAWDEIKEAVHRAWHEVKETLGVQDPYDVTFSSLRQQYDERFAEMGYPQDEDYEPGYRYGYFLAADERYRDRTWNDVRPHIKKYWEENPIGELENFMTAAEDAWNEVKSQLK